MIDRQASRVSLLVAIVVFVTACSEDNGVDYCKNHYQFHADHLDSIANLTISYSDAGDLAGRLTVPPALFGELPEADVRAQLGKVETTFTLESEIACTVSVLDVLVSDEVYVVDYAASCGADNKLGRIDVSLFDKFAGIEEVVTRVTTSATEKRFAISRQCERPIFRLE